MIHKSIIIYDYARTNASEKMRRNSTHESY